MTKDLQKYCGFVADAFAQTRSITNISVTDDLKLEMSRARSTGRCEGNFVRVAAERGIQIFTKSTTVNHVRVTSTDMPYHGANFHGRGLKIRLCGLTVSTGALNAVEIYVKKKRKILSEDVLDLLENERSTVLNAEPKPRSSQSTLTGKKIRTSLGSSCAEQIHVPPPPVTVYPKYFPHFRLAWGPSSS